MSWETTEDDAAVARYFAALPLPARATALTLDKLVRRALPKAKPGIKWGVPFYAMRGPVCYISVSKTRVSLGLLKGVHVKDASGLLVGTPKSPIRKAVFRVGDDVPTTLVLGWLREARRLDATWGRDEASPP